MIEYENSEDILSYLQSNFSLLYSIAQRKNDDFRGRFEAFDSVQCYEDTSFQWDGNPYIFRFQPNLVTKRLYFSIFDVNGEAIQSFEPLSAYPTNLATAQVLEDCEITFYANGIWLKNEIL